MGVRDGAIVARAEGRGALHAAASAGAPAERSRWDEVGDTDRAVPEDVERHFDLRRDALADGRAHRPRPRQPRLRHGDGPRDGGSPCDPLRAGADLQPVDVGARVEQQPRGTILSSESAGRPLRQVRSTHRHADPPSSREVTAAGSPDDVWRTTGGAFAARATTSVAVVDQRSAMRSATQTAATMAAHLRETIDEGDRRLRVSLATVALRSACSVPLAEHLPGVVEDGTGRPARRLSGGPSSWSRGPWMSGSRSDLE